MGAWFVGLAGAPGVCSHITRAIVPMASWVGPAMPPVMGACEVLGVGLSVGDGVGLSVGDGVGLEDVGDDDGDGLLCAGELGAAHGVDDGRVPLCAAEAPPEGTLELP